MKVINLFAGPGVGKSTTAAMMYSMMKMRGDNVELVTEYAKELVYGDRMDSMCTQQEYILTEQNYRQHRLRDKVDYIITDSPLLLGLVYVNQETYPIFDEFKQFNIATFNLYENINIYLNRTSTIKYQENGRYQTYIEAIEKDQEIKDLLDTNNIDYHTVNIGPTTSQNVLDIVDTFATK